MAARATWRDLERDDLIIVPGWKVERTCDPLPDALAAGVRDHWDAGAAGRA